MTAIEQLALEAGAAKFYPETQSVIKQNYVVSAGFLQRFHDLVCEACAKEAEDADVPTFNYCMNTFDDRPALKADIASAIRARKDSA